MEFTTTPRTIGKDNGGKDTFLADVEYGDGNTGRIILHENNLQMASMTLRFYSKMWDFTVVHLS